MKSALFILLVSIVNIPQGFNDRRIIVITASKNSPEVAYQIHQLEKRALDLEKRRLAVFTLIDGKVNAILNSTEKSEEFVKNNKIDYSATSVPQFYLVGLDKTIKQTFRNFVQPQQVFDIVDSMPIRRAEMRRN